MRRLSSWAPVSAAMRKMWRDLAVAHPTRIGVRIGFDEGLAHLIEGGADLFLMPSRFEPCGLNQMYSMRYGTVPVVRATGGLDDTVRPFDPETGAGTGFTFPRLSVVGDAGSAREGACGHASPARWRALQQAGMRQDFSWTPRPPPTSQEYRSVIERRSEAEARERTTGSERMRDVSHHRVWSGRTHRRTLCRQSEPGAAGSSRGWSRAGN